MTVRCPECGAIRQDGTNCGGDFHQMLFWEAEHPDYGEVHHLMVLCYHLQHPQLYSVEGLAEAKRLLVEFVERGVSPADARRRSRDRVDSGRRDWKITARPSSRGTYSGAVRWTMTAADVVAAGPDRYRDSVRAWARSVLDALKESDEE